VYVHGLGGSATNWTDLAALLAPRLAGVALDLPGFGRSGPPRGNDYSIRAHAGTVVAYLEQERGGPVHLFGNSMGGAIAATVAADRPDLVRTLTLISPAVPDLWPRASRQDPVLPLMMLPRIGPAVLRRFERITPEARVRAMLKMCWADPTAVPPERLGEAIAEIRYRSELGWSSDALVRSLRGLVGSYLAPPGRGPWAQLARIAAPTLVIWGDRDRLVSASRAPRTARTIPDARLLVVPDAGHVAQMERPHVVARAVLGLLDGVADAKATT
jgi:pimeloyl-ACP methyl ester carboxylesterase